MEIREKIRQLPEKIQRAIRRETAILADVGQELIFVETGVTRSKPYFYDTCLEFAFEQYEAGNIR